MPSDRHVYKTYLNDDEAAHVDGLAEQLRLSRSDLLRRLVMAHHMPKASDFVAWQSVRDVLKANADLARLGNLFKLALDEGFPSHLAGRLEALMTEIAATQGELKGAACDIRSLVQPRRARAPRES